MKVTKKVITIPRKVAYGTISDRVKWLREEVFGLSQTEFGNATDSNRSQIQQIERGNARHPKNIDAIQRFTDFNRAWIVFGSSSADPKGHIKKKPKS